MADVVLPPPAPAPVDRLAAVFARVQVTAHVFKAGLLCGVNTVAPGGGGHLHLLRRGIMAVEGPDGQRAEVVAPAAVLLVRPAEHRLLSDPEIGVDIVCAEIDFGGSGNPLRQGLPALLVLPLVEDASLGGILALLFQEADGAGCGRQAALDRLAEVALIYLLRRAMGRSDQGPGLLAGLVHPALARVLTRLHEAPGSNWTLETMAEVAGMSRSAFAETFRRVVGVPPGDYLQGWRLQLARAGIEAGRPLKQVAREVGYASHAALSRALSQRLGGSARSLLRRRRDLAGPAPEARD
jgi:AraC-like DNA-binding protein